MAHFKLELLSCIANVFYRDVHYRETGWFRVFHAQYGLSPFPFLVLTVVHRHRVFELSSGLQLEVIPRHELHRLSQRVPLGVVVSHRVEAVVGDVLAGLGGEHLQEGDLVAVSLVRQLEPSGLGWNV